MSEFVELTVITYKLKQEVNDSIKKTFLGGVNTNKSKDSYGRDAEFYRDLGIEPPEDLDDEEQQDKVFNIKDEDFEVVESPSRFKVDNIVFFVADDKGGSTIYIDIDYSASVKESVEEIELRINKLR
jgi:hypothetical protein